MRVLEDWELTPERAAVHVPTRTAVIADLHLGYGQARNRSGEAVPIQHLSQILLPLRNVVEQHSVEQLIIAGDLLEKGRSAEVIDDLLRWLTVHAITLKAVIPGNHDRGLSRAGGQLPIVEDVFTLGEWQIVHGDQDLPSGKVVQGHLHPCLRWDRRQASPCYLVSEKHLILPAYSADASGMNVLGGRCWNEYQVCAVTAERVLALGKNVSRKFFQTRAGGK